MSTPRLCVFARAPELGRVKSRLAGALGEAGALAAYCTLVRDTLTRLAAVPGVHTEFWLEGTPNAEVAGWLDAFVLPLRLQRGVDLGARMEHALSSCLDDGVVGLVVGTDCPPIDAAYVARALSALAGADVVLGPASDGGYGLVGLRRPCPALFRDVPWGTSAVLATTLDRAREAAATVALLEPIWDVDTLPDWQRFLAGRAAQSG